MIEKSNLQKSQENPFIGFVLGISKIFFLLMLFAILFLILPFLLPDTFEYGSLGSLGDTFGGFVNPIVAIVAALLTFLAFYVQYLANQKIQEQFLAQQSSDHFYKMLDIHIKNVEAFEIKTKNVVSKGNQWFKINVEGTYEDSQFLIETALQRVLTSYKLTQFNLVLGELNLDKNETIYVKGRRCFLLMIKDLHFTLQAVHVANNSLKEIKISEDKANELAYKIFFWGTDSEYISHTDDGDKGEKEIVRRLNWIRISLRSSEKAKVNFNHKTESTNKVQYFQFIPFSGHSSRLAHYYRHLYQMVKQLHFSFQNGAIDEIQLFRNLDTLRAQLSNEEQLLLYYNFRIGFGGRWDYRKDWKEENRSDYQFLTKYRMIHNIPLYNTISDKVEPPLNCFDVFIKDNPNFDLFEWK